MAEKAYFHSPIDPKLRAWEKGIAYLSKKYPERKETYDRWMKQHIEAIGRVGNPAQHGQASLLFEKRMRDSLVNDPKNARAWNDLASEVNQPFWETWKSTVYDKYKAQDQDSYLAGIKPVNVAAICLPRRW